MGQKIFDDKIGQLTHSAGNILMAASVSSPAYLTIGGQQYTVTAQLSVALPAMTANTRYQVYAVQSAGVVSLAISQNENSVGPAGYSSWKLVGSLMSNGAASVVFGAFLTIKGIPKTIGAVSGEQTDIGAVTTPPTKSVAPLVDNITYTRLGKMLFADNRYAYTTAGASAGSGAYLPRLPLNLTFDSNYHSFDTGLGTAVRSDMNVGTGAQHQSGVDLGVNVAIPYSSTRYQIIYTSPTVSQAWSSTAFALNNGNSRFHWRIEAYITEWSDTPIEDL